MGYGKKAARNIDRMLTGEERWASLWPEFEYDMTVPAHPSASRRHRVREPDPLERVRDFREATYGLTTVEAMEEACRCLRCDIRNGD
jgi:hypothetical protein